MQIKFDFNSHDNNLKEFSDYVSNLTDPEKLRYKSQDVREAIRVAFENWDYAQVLDTAQVIADYCKSQAAKIEAETVEVKPYSRAKPEPIDLPFVYVDKERYANLLAAEATLISIQGGK